jgi:hypothetical protein
VQLNLDKETVTCVGKGLNFGPTIGFSVTVLPKFSLSGPKIGS